MCRRVFLLLFLLLSLFHGPCSPPAGRLAPAIQDFSTIGTRILRDIRPAQRTRDPAESPLDVMLVLMGSVVPVVVVRRLRVVVYCRYSSVEQNPRSLEEQAAKCREYLRALGLGDLEIIEITDAETSGELLRRGGIDEVRDLVRSGGCDLIVTEDASRLYRNTTFAMGFFDEAADAGVRVLAINDRIDTADAHWRMNAHFASICGEMYNADTAARIRRSIEGRWRDGYAVGCCKPGYRRIPTKPATEREPARGPYRDEKDPQ
jgi:DNA invertase Pin-like site-specific DNA recombinase